MASPAGSSPTPAKGFRLTVTAVRRQQLRPRHCQLSTLHSQLFTPPQVRPRVRKPDRSSVPLSGSSNVPKVGRKKKLSCRPLLEIVAMLYTYKIIVSPRIYDAGLSELRTFVDDRMVKHISYFSSNLLVTSSLEFLQKIVDNLT